MSSPEVKKTETVTKKVDEPQKSETAEKKKEVDVELLLKLLEMRKRRLDKIITKYAALTQQ